MINPFFQNKGPFRLDKILSYINVENDTKKLDTEISNIKDLVTCLLYTSDAADE